MDAMKAKKRKEKKVAPCKVCKGFAVPARRVKSVARNARGQFRRSKG